MIINGHKVNGLTDSGSTDSFIHPNFVSWLSLPVSRSDKPVTMASTSMTTNSAGFCVVDIHLNGRRYEKVKLSVLPQLCADVILGQDFQAKHESVMIKYGGPLPPLMICGVAAMDVEPPDLFSHSRRYSYEDRQFIEKEIQRLLGEGISSNLAILLGVLKW